MKKVGGKKSTNGDNIADAIIDLCFVTSYKIEELLKMPRSRLDRLLERFQERFPTGGKK
jgi:hypothetical protein